MRKTTKSLLVIIFILLEIIVLTGCTNKPEVNMYQTLFDITMKQGSIKLPDTPPLKIKNNSIVNIDKNAEGLSGDKAEQIPASSEEKKTPEDFKDETIKTEIPPAPAEPTPTPVVNEPTPSPAATPVVSPEPTQVQIKRGDKGETVSNLQTKLNQIGYTVTVDGSFGEETDYAIRDFQKQSGQAVDGIATNDTLSGIEQSIANGTKYTPTPRPIIKENMTAEEKEFYVNSFNNESSTGYFIWTNLSIHEVNIFTGSKENWKLAQSFEASVGKSSTPTIQGRFKVGNKGTAFGWDKGYICKYFTQIKGGYLFHSIVYDLDGKTVLDGRLGKNISHGCVRLETNNAKWIYDNIPRDTGIWIN